VESLKTSGITLAIQEFNQGTQKGDNVVATIPSKGASSSAVLLGAHLDRVNVGQGAVDNGASCAILVELAKRLKAQPLETTTVTIAFFDLEEAGLPGSAAYFQQLEATPARQKP
jgi:aminopeptidase S